MDSENYDRAAADLMAFIDASPTPFQAVAVAAQALDNAGFTALDERQAWKLEPGGGYYTVRNGSALIAFRLPVTALAEHGFRIVGVHTDAPGFKIKPGGMMITGDGYLKLNTEGYGGAILATWFDRPLAVAGRLAVAEGGGAVSMRLVNLSRPLVTIPNLCIHFNRDCNSGLSYNKQTDCLPLLGLASDHGGDSHAVLAMAADAAGVPVEAVLDHDLYLYEASPSVRLGVRDELVSAPRLDNLAMVQTGLAALLQHGEAKAAAVLAAFDNEEVGSVTAAGANSAFLATILNRIGIGLGLNEEERSRAMAASMALSADAAHAVHPNHPERHDPVNRPLLGHGITIKYSANQRYVTTAETAAIFAEVCRAADVPVQRFVNRSDVTGGSTIGPALSSITGIRCADAGIPLLAMHSIRELGSAADIDGSRRAFSAWYRYDG